MAKIGKPWDNPDAEYAALAQLLVPGAHARYERAMQAWDATETNALGFLALAAAIVAGLASVRNVLPALWWLPASGCGLAAALFVASVWPRTGPEGPDLFDLHEDMRGSTLAEAARTMFDFVMRAGEWAEQTVTSKIKMYSWGLFVLSVSAVGSIPVIVWRA